MGWERSVLEGALVQTVQDREVGDQQPLWLQYYCWVGMVGRMLEGVDPNELK